MKTAKARQPVEGPAVAAPLAEEGQVAPVMKPLRAAQCRKHLRNAVAEAFPEIVAGFLEQAKGGSCQHLKMALEMMERRKSERAPGKGSAQLMLEKFQRQMEAE